MKFGMKETSLKKSNNALVPRPTIHHSGTEMCTFLFETGVFWDIG